MDETAEREALALRVAVATFAAMMSQHSECSDARVRLHIVRALELGDAFANAWAERGPALAELARS